MNELDLFAAAIAISDEGERNALLERECSGNPALRARLLNLLEVHFQSQPLIDAGPVDAGVTASHQTRTETPGTIIAGRYKLLQQIGEGGMGSVWMADQTEPIKRRVALKLIRAERGNSKTILSRFEAERQAIALMDHPHVAKLLDAGTTDAGTPFFVMELVKGVPLTDYCDQHKLDVHDRLALFIQICSAVQHAHQKGIIHRDLKPTNILVENHDGYAVPKVIDFGLAKATTGLQLTEHTLFTGFGNVMGTPLYMAPEQATFNAVDVDTRADIYVLGVILYELLTGTTPLTRESIKKAQLVEMLKLIREQEAPTPSSRLSSAESDPSVAMNRQTEPAKLGRFVKGELDWIVMKALSKERDRRYESATGFAKDIERFLNHEPVQAGPPSASYRLKKFVQRNRLQVIAGTLVLIVLLAGIVGTTLGLIEAKYQERVAVAAQTREAAARRREKARADGEARQRQRADDEKKRAIQFRDQALDALRATTSEDVEKLIGGKTQLSQNEREYLKAIANRWLVFAKQTGTDEESRTIQAEGYSRVGLLYAKLGLRDEARTELLAASELGKKLVEQIPTARDHKYDLARVNNNLGILLSDLGENEAASDAYVSSRDLLEDLAKQFPDEPKYRRNLAKTYSNLAKLYMSVGDESTLAEIQAARDIWQKLVEQFPDSPNEKAQLAFTRMNLGVYLDAAGKGAASQIEYESARALQLELVQKFPEVPDYRRHLAQTHTLLGNRLADIGELAAAQSEFMSARDQRLDLVARFPAVFDYQYDLVGTQNDLGRLLIRLGEHEAARAELMSARERMLKLLEQASAVQPYKSRLVETHNDLGELLRAMQKPQEARREYLASRELGKELIEKSPAVSEYHLGFGAACCNLGVLARDDGQLNHSLSYFQEAIHSLTELNLQDGLQVVATEYLRNCYWGRARTFEQMHEAAQALEDWAQAIELSTPEEQPIMRAKRVMSRIRMGMFYEAVSEVTDLTKSEGWTADQWYSFARVYSIASGKVPDKKQEYADRAMELLQHAVRAGWNDAQHTSTDTDLDPLREREDFKKLVAELEMNNATNTEPAPNTLEME